MDPLHYFALCSIFASLGVALVLRNRRKRVRRRMWVRPWLRRRDHPDQSTMIHLYKELLMDGDVAEFQATLRMSPSVFNNLLDLLTPSLTKRITNCRKPISARIRLAVTLRHLALGDGFRSLSHQFRIGLSTARLIVRQTCKAIAQTLHDRHMKTPRSSRQWLKLSDDFNRKWSFPHCLGAVDGKHIRICQPPNSGTYYYNYKGYFSIVLMAIVDSDYQFLYLDIGAEGKASDGGVWQNCSFNEYLTHADNPLGIPKPEELPGIKKEMPFYLIGDEAFRLGPHMIKPYPAGGNSRKQQIFNYRLSRGRRIVENAFGILTCRFRIFHQTIAVGPDYATDIVLACCSLHNYLRDQARMEYIPSVVVDQELPNGDITPGAWRQEPTLDNMMRNTQRNASQYAKEVRNNLADYFLTKEGELLWQYNRDQD